MGCNIHNEDFFLDNPYVNRLKLRASYGMSGSQQFSSYQAMETYSYYTGDRYNIWMGAYQMALGNKNLEWQTTDKYNIGVEGEFFNSRVSVLWMCIWRKRLVCCLRWSYLILMVLIVTQRI